MSTFKDNVLALVMLWVGVIGTGWAFGGDSARSMEPAYYVGATGTLGLLAAQAVLVIARRLRRSPTSVGGRRPA